MTPSLRFATAVILASSIGGHAQQVDMSDMNTAVAKFFEMLYEVSTQAETAQDAAAVARILETWAAANEEFGRASREFAEKHPGIFAAKEPPAEFAASFKRMQNMRQEFPSLAQKIGTLVKDHENDATVKSAAERFQRSVVSVQQSTRPATPSAATPPAAATPAPTPR